LFLANTSCHSNVDRMCYFYHMNKLLSLLLIGFITTIISCKGKKTESVSNNSLIDVVSIIKAQIKHVDTSLFSIIKLEWADTTHTDTTYIKREDFEAVAKDFLQLPELSNPKIAKDYKQESRYDSLTRKVIISYFPKEDKNEIRKIELMASVDEIGKDGNNKVTNILVEKGKTDRNGSLIQKMYWNADRNFSIISFSQLPGQPEKTTTTKVIWNDDSFQ
jgi:hypothetical protein